MRCPHARGGGPGVHPYRLCAIDVVPMLVGVVRFDCELDAMAKRCPHARGGGPQTQTLIIAYPRRCPHARGGGPDGSSPLAHLERVVPMLVGVVRLQRTIFNIAICCPHARGGGPIQCAI